MNIIDIQDDLKNLPENALMQEFQQPTGNAPQFLILGELKRRKQMREDYQRQQNSDMKTVAEETITGAGVPQEGIMQMARSMTPKTNMAQDTGVAQAMPVQPTQAPQPQQPQMMSDGGIIRLAPGGFPDRAPNVTSGFGSNIEYTYDTFLKENYFNDTPETREMFLKYKKYMDTREPPSDPKLFNALNFDKSPREPDGSLALEKQAELLNSNDSEVSNFLSNSGSLARPEMPTMPGLGGLPNQELPVFDATVPEPANPTEDSIFPEGVPGQMSTDQRYAPPDAQRDDILRFLRQAEGTTTDNRSLIDAIDAGKVDSDNVVAGESGDLELGPRKGLFFPGETYPEVESLNRRAQAYLQSDMYTPPDQIYGIPDPANPTEGSVFNQPRSVADSPFSNVPRFNPDSLQGAVDRDRELGDGIIPSSVSSETIPSPVGDGNFTATGTPFDLESPAIDYSNLAISTLNRLADEGDDRAINQLRLNEVSGLQTQSDISTGGDDLYMDSIMRDTLEQGTSDAAYASSLYDPSNIPRDENTISSLEQYLILNPDNVQAQNQLATAQAQLVDSESERETAIELQGTSGQPVTTIRPPDNDPTKVVPEVADEVVDGEVVTSKEPNLIIQEPITTDAQQRREAAESTGGIAALKPKVPDTNPDASTSSSTSSSGGAYGSIESRISKMLSDRESSAESDKWMALAQTGMALMASRNPTFGGALGEAGLAGVGALQKSKKAYDSDIMGLLGMQQKIQSAKSLDASRTAKSATGGSKELNTMIDNARADLTLANAAAAKYFRIEPGDPTTGTQDRMINMIPQDVQANVVAARDRLEALNRIAIGGGTQFDATQ